METVATNRIPRTAVEEEVTCNPAKKERRTGMSKKIEVGPPIRL